MAEIIFSDIYRTFLLCFLSACIAFGARNAKNMGMKTIWVKQGMGQYWIFSDESERPDYEVDSLSEIMEVL